MNRNRGARVLHIPDKRDISTDCVSAHGARTLPRSLWRPVHASYAQASIELRTWCARRRQQRTTRPYLTEKDTLRAKVRAVLANATI